MPLARTGRCNSICCLTIRLNPPESRQRIVMSLTSMFVGHSQSLRQQSALGESCRFQFIHQRKVYVNNRKEMSKESVLTHCNSSANAPLWRRTVWELTTNNGVGYIARQTVLYSTRTLAQEPRKSTSTCYKEEPGKQKDSASRLQGTKDFKKRYIYCRIKSRIYDDQPEENKWTTPRSFTPIEPYTRIPVRDRPCVSTTLFMSDNHVHERIHEYGSKSTAGFDGISSLLGRLDSPTWTETLGVEGIFTENT